MKDKAHMLHNPQAVNVSSVQYAFALPQKEPNFATIYSIYFVFSKLVMYSITQSRWDFRLYCFT